MTSWWDDVRVVARWMGRAWSPHPGWLALIVGVSVVSAGLNVAFPWLWKSAVDDLGSGEVSPGALAGWLLATGVGHAAVYLGLQGARSYMNREITRIARVFAIDRLADADPELIASWRAGDWVARLHDDADEKSSWFLCSGIFRAWEAALVGGGALVGVVVTQPALAPWALAPLPLLLVAVAVTQRSAAARNREVQAAVSATADQLATTFGAIRTVQAARLEGVARARFAVATEAQQRAEVRAAVLQNATGYLFQSGWQFAVAGLIWFGGQAVLRGELTLGAFVTLEGLLSTLVWPMFDFGILVSRLPATAVSLRRLDAVIDVPLAPTPSGRVPTGVELRADALHVGPWLRDVTVSVGPRER
ncbi:MAG: ABC transporter transmembrane domain-containing protein, partial [Myxococcota bacterium]